MMGIQILSTLGLVIFYFAARTINKRLLGKHRSIKGVDAPRVRNIEKYFNGLILLVALLLLSFVWGVDYKGLLVLASSFFALVGISLFATWSILSNITSSVIIFFVVPVRSKDRIRVIDGENTVEGVISEITLFHVMIRDDSGNAVSYPNNLFMQKPVVNLESRKKSPDEQNKTVS